MQSNDGRFYCVSCGQLMEMSNAEILFRTGYFRVVHPLGCCYACESKQNYADMLPDHQRRNARRSMADIGQLPAGLEEEGSSTACETPGLTVSGYSSAGEERFAVSHMSLL